MFTVNKNPTERDLYKFGWAMLVGFSLIGALLWVAPWVKTRDAAALGWSGTNAQIAALTLVALGVALCALSQAAPAWAKPVYVVWMSATVPIGIVMSTILLSVLFFLLLPAFSLFVRFGDPLRKKLGGRASYWEPYKPHEPTLERTARPF